jgi:hypothetical protein
MSPSTRYNDRAPILDGKACRASVQMSPHADTAAFPNAVSASPLSYSEPSPLTGLDQEYQRGRTMGFARAQPILRARKNICCVRRPKFTSNKFLGNPNASRFVTASKKTRRAVSAYRLQQRRIGRLIFLQVRLKLTDNTTLCYYLIVPLKILQQVRRAGRAIVRSL